MREYEIFCDRLGLDPRSAEAKTAYINKTDPVFSFALVTEAPESTSPGSRQWLRDRIKALATELYSQSGKSSADHETYALLRQAAGLQEDQIIKEAMSHERTI